MRVDTFRIRHERTAMIKRGQYISIAEAVGDRTGRARKKKRAQAIRRIKNAFFIWGNNVMGLRPPAMCAVCKEPIRMTNRPDEQEISCNLMIVEMVPESKPINFLSEDVAWICKRCHDRNGMHSLDHNGKSNRMRSLIKKYPTVPSFGDIWGRARRQHGCFDKKN